MVGPPCCWTLGNLKSAGAGDYDSGGALAVGDGVGTGVGDATLPPHAKSDNTPAHTIMPNVADLTGSNCSDLRGSTGYPASCGGVAKHGFSSANPLRPLKREQLPFKPNVCLISTAAYTPSMGK